MKKNELNQLKNLNLKELMEKAGQVKKELADLLIDKNMRKLKDIKSFNKKRKESAQILTVIEQKMSLAKLESKAEEKLKKGEKLVTSV